MSKKFLHVTAGIIKAITLEGERTPFGYGAEVVEVPLDLKVGVGDEFKLAPAEAPEAPEAPKGPKKAGAPKE